MRSSYETLSLSEAEFNILRDLIREHTGLSYDKSKRDLLADKLSPRAVECGFNAFIDYYYLLKYGPGAEEEWRHVLNCLSVQETYFWREMDQIRALVDIVIPRLVLARPGETLRIWCAACATGEEPLTIAMALNEAHWFDRAPVQILASDGSPSAIEKAQQGFFRERSFRSLPQELRAKYFRQGEAGWQVIPELHRRVQWLRANLMVKQEVASILPASVVFCRNAFIYFSPEAIVQTVRLFAEGVSQPGYLYVGVSESLLKFTTDFDLQEIGNAFVYAKR